MRDWKAKLDRIFAIAEPAAVAGLFFYLAAKSWLRWSDPLVDFPRDLYYAWRISAGDHLYTNLANWYGPLANLAEGAGFRVFGVGLDTVVWMNITLTVVALLLLRAIFGGIGNRLSVWLGSVVFLVVFAFGNLSENANYNFITPYVAQSTYSFLGLLLVLWGLLKHLHTEKSHWLAVTGFGFAVTYLDKPEAMLAAAGALGIYFVAQILQKKRRGLERPIFRRLTISLGWLLGGFLALWLPVLGYFLALGGWAYAFDATNHVLVIMFNAPVRLAAIYDPFELSQMGLDHVRENFIAQLKAGAIFVALAGTLLSFAWAWGRTRRHSLGWRALPVLAAGTAAFAGWLGFRENSWMGIGSALALPVILAALGLAGWSLCEAWRNGKNFSHTLGLAVIGVAASLMLARIILNVRLSNYGFFMMPLAVWFTIHVLVVESAQLTRDPEKNKPNGLAPLCFTVLTLLAAGTIGQFELKVYAAKTFAMGEGRDHFFTFQPYKDTSGDIKRINGLMLKMMIDYMHQAPKVKTLTVLPGGIAANYHLRLRTSLRELDFNPMVLAFTGEGNVIQELRDNPPEKLLLNAWDYSDYGDRFFGADERTGRGILFWLSDHYDITDYFGQSEFSLSRHIIDFASPKKDGGK